SLRPLASCDYGFSIPNPGGSNNKIQNGSSPTVCCNQGMTRARHTEVECPCLHGVTLKPMSNLSKGKRNCREAGEHCGMKRPRSKRILVLCGLLVIVVGLPGLWVSHQKQQYARNRALIAAIQANDTPKALALLEQGADPNTREKPDEPQSPWKLLW